jgi:hypothetical protein
LAHLDSLVGGGILAGAIGFAEKDSIGVTTVGDCTISPQSSSSSSSLAVSAAGMFVFVSRGLRARGRSAVADGAKAESIDIAVAGGL